MVRVFFPSEIIFGTEKTGVTLISEMISSSQGVQIGGLASATGEEPWPFGAINPDICTGIVGSWSTSMHDQGSYWYLRCSLRLVKHGLFILRRSRWCVYLRLSSSVLNAILTSLLKDLSGYGKYLTLTTALSWILPS